MSFDDTMREFHRRRVERIRRRLRRIRRRRRDPVERERYLRRVIDRCSIDELAKREGKTVEELRAEFARFGISSKS